MTSPEEKIKRKINVLIDRIGKLKRDVDNQMMQIELIWDDITTLQSEGLSEFDEISLEQESSLFAFMKDFCLIARVIIDKMLYIEYNYKTKCSDDYYKIAQKMFDDVVCIYADMDLKTFLNFCIDLGIIKSEQNRRCTYSSGEIRVYYVSRFFVDAAAQKETPYVNPCEEMF